MREETDFFSSLSSSEAPASDTGPRPVPVPAQETQPDLSLGAPDVSVGLSAPVAAPVPKKSTIGAKKAPAKKAGLGAKKGKKTCGDISFLVVLCCRFGSSEGNQKLC